METIDGKFELAAPEGAEIGASESARRRERAVACVGRALRHHEGARRSALEARRSAFLHLINVQQVALYVCDLRDHGGAFSMKAVAADLGIPRTTLLYHVVAADRFISEHTVSRAEIRAFSMLDEEDVLLGKEDRREKFTGAAAKAITKFWRWSKAEYQGGIGVGVQEINNRYAIKTTAKEKRAEKAAVEMEKLAESGFEFEWAAAQKIMRSVSDWIGKEGAETGFRRLSDHGILSVEGEWGDHFAEIKKVADQVRARQGLSRSAKRIS